MPELRQRATRMKPADKFACGAWIAVVALTCVYVMVVG